MRTLVLRLLLLAVFFNAAIGMPLHEASHFAGMQVAGSGAADVEDATGHDKGEDGVCQLCVAHAQQATAVFAATLASLLLPDAPALLVPREPATVAFGDGRWSVAARGPPTLI